MRERGRRMRRRAGANAGSLAGGGALTRRDRPGSDAGAGPAAPAAEEGEGGSRSRLAVGGSLVSFSCGRGVVGVRVDARSSGLGCWRFRSVGVGLPLPGLHLATRRQL